MIDTHPQVLVIGGGSAGVAASVGAARAGTSVVLLERYSYLGGKATGAQVGTVCGLYQFSKNKESHYIVKGFAMNDPPQNRSPPSVPTLFTATTYTPFATACPRCTVCQAVYCSWLVCSSCESAHPIAVG